MLTSLAKNTLGGRMLFHFTSFNLERLAQVLQDSKIYFSRPAEFNDPFELSPYVDMDAVESDDTRERWVNAYAEAIKSRYGDTGFAKEQARIAAARVSADAARELLCHIPASLASVLQNKYRVYCLSTQLRSVQMWSHYGAKHQGLALEFTSTAAFFGMAFRVNYASVATHIDPEATIGDDLFIQGLLTKAEPWKPEDEYRLVATDEEEEGFIRSAAGLANFPAAELTGVYVGCRMPDACIRAVVNEAMVRDKQIPVYRMLKVPKLLSLSAERIFPKG